MNKNENRMFHSFSEALPVRKGRGKAEKKQPFCNFALHKPHIAKFKRRCRRNETPKEKIFRRSIKFFRRFNAGEKALRFVSISFPAIRPLGNAGSKPEVHQCFLQKFLGDRLKPKPI